MIDIVASQPEVSIDLEAVFGTIEDRLTEASRDFKNFLNIYLDDAVTLKEHGATVILRKINQLKRDKKDTYSFWESQDFDEETINREFRRIGKLNKFQAKRPSQDNPSKGLPLFYHYSEDGYSHTMGHVLPNAIRILDKELNKGNISVREAGMGAIAAVFHDTGFVHCMLNNDFDFYDKNEPKGIKLAMDYMKKSKFHFTDSDKAVVSTAIAFTNVYLGEPPTKVAEAVTDADLSYLGESNRGRFLEVERRLREELYYRPHANLYKAAEGVMEKLIEAYNLTDKEFGKYSTKKHRDLFNFAWHMVSMGFMQNHHRWHTDSAKELFEGNKRKNVLFYARQIRDAKQQFENQYCLKQIKLTDTFKNLNTTYRSTVLEKI